MLHWLNTQYITFAPRSLNQKHEKMKFHEAVKKFGSCLFYCETATTESENQTNSAFDQFIFYEMGHVGGCFFQAGFIGCFSDSKHSG